MPNSQTQRTKSIRGTQTFVGVMAWVWKHPGIVALEILWRWLWGVPALWISFSTVGRIILQSPVDWVAIKNASLLDPMKAAEAAGAAAVILMPPLTAAITWLAPLLMLTWVAAHTIGRTVVLHRIDSTLQPRPATYLVLTLLRLIALATSFFIWWRALLWISTVTIANPVAAGKEPSVVGYCALVIIVTMFIFVAWGVVSWVFSIAPLLAVMRGTSSIQSIRDALHLGTLKQKLVEINLVMGIVKIALIVLAMVFSATPLPFQSVTTDAFLHTWWFGVTLLYLIASDFFHVARTVAYIRLYRASANTADSISH